MPRLRRLLPVAVLVVALAAGWAAAGDPPAPPGPPAPAPSWAASAAPFLATWCAACHGGAKPEAGLDVAALALDPPRLDVLTHLLEVRRRVAAGEMPPAEAERAPVAETRRFLEALDGALVAGDAALPADPGRVLVRRLSRFEYGRTVKHLLALDVEPGQAFPADDLAYGFDNIGDVLSVSPLLLEKYADTAADIAKRAVWLEDPDHPPAKKFEAEGMTSSLGPNSQRGDSAGLFANGTVTTQVTLPREGEYVLRARAFGQQAGPDPCRMAFVVDGKPAATVDVPEKREAPAVKEHRLRLAAGPHVVGVAFTNDYYKPQDPDPTQRDRNLVVDWVEVVGPVDRREVPASHRLLFAKDPGKGAPKVRATPILRDLVARAWRRPASVDEVSRLALLVQGAVDEGKRFEEGVGLALQAVLVSPNFLFRLEPGAATGAGGSPRDLDGYAIATRLSYFLWSSLPDEALLLQASRGRLSDPAVLAAEARRMLEDEKAWALAENFAVQWLELRNLEGAAPDPGRFPGFDALREPMRKEAVYLFGDVLREKRDVRDLLAPGFTYVNAALAAHYGFPGVEGEAFRRVPLADGRRGGVLGLAGVLTVTSNPTRTSPVKRGKWVLENVLDAPAKPPLPGVDSLDETAVVRSAASLREKMEAHRAKPECAVCHARMDALGFALERYDAVGRWREADGGQPIDARGALPDGRTLDGPEALRQALKDDDAFLRCLARKLFTFALGRTPSPRDALALFARVARLSGPGKKVTLEDLVVEIVRMEAFRQRRPGA